MSQWTHLRLASKIQLEILCNAYENRFDLQRRAESRGRDKRHRHDNHITYCAFACWCVVFFLLHLIIIIILIIFGAKVAKRHNNETYRYHMKQVTRYTTVYTSQLNYPAMLLSIELVILSCFYTVIHVSRQSAHDFDTHRVIMTMATIFCF